MMTAECLLQRVQFPGSTETLDGQHVGAFQLAGEQQAGQGQRHLPAIDCQVRDEAAIGGRERGGRRAIRQ
jgi:hypothetical protein